MGSSNSGFPVHLLNQLKIYRLSYFNWMWEHSCLGTTAAQRAGLASQSWSWPPLLPFPHFSDSQPFTTLSSGFDRLLKHALVNGRSLEARKGDRDQP